MGEPQQQNITLRPGYDRLLERLVVCLLKVSTNLKLFENRFKVAWFIVKEALNNLLSSDFAEKIDDVADRM